MELSNSITEKKNQQVEIFQKFATELKRGDSGDSSKLVLTFNDFIDLISSSRSLYSRFTDHSYNLNQIPDKAFGCIFFAVDENNKGYLTLNDWFHFNNLLECNNYHLIILYEFFRKFDVANLKRKAASIENSSPSAINIANNPRIRPPNYGSKFLSFDSLYLDLTQFKSTIKFLQECVDNEFITANNLFLNWDEFRWLKFYQSFPYGLREGSHINLNSLVTILQNDLKNEKLFMGFDRLSHTNHKNHSLVLNKNQLVYLLKVFYSHRISADVFNSLDLSNTKMIKSNNNYINYNVFKDIFYLFQNFDLLNQVFMRYAKTHNFDDQDLRECYISKEDLTHFLSVEYNKVNNITEFSPSQISLLFSIVANSKRNKLIEKSLNTHHEDSTIERFIQTDFCHGMSPKNQELKEFNNNYREVIGGMSGELDTAKNRRQTTKAGLIDRILKSKETDETWLEFNLTMEDFMKILNPNYLNDLVHQMEIRRIQSESLYTNFYFFPIFDSIYNFLLGSVAGCIGATAVYPIDLVKTRMQAQRNFSQYKNSIDCFVKIFSREGVRGIYSGLGPQLVGVAPEKAIKLTVNDYVRKMLMDSNNHLTLPLEILSGASAGACQVIFTNPLEIVKIRLQVRSEYAESISRSQVNAFGIVKSLGLRGLYRGIGACLMRDVPFSAIYFPTYAHLKKDIFNYDPQDKNGRTRLRTWELLTAGGLAGMPAAYLTTPFDVIKTRLQIDPRKGETKYNGIWHAAKTILKEERFKSFFKGGGARVLRSSPQFGFTLAAYEIFQNLFPLKHSEVNNTKQDDDTPIVTGMFSSFLESLKKSSNQNVEITEFFGPSVDPYSSNYLNYYYKSCQVAKLFIDLDYNFAKFDFGVYSKFHKFVKDAESPSK
ncbi:citrin [Lachancea thermotolerans CBS 6340]|uniref:Mitochondrial aspartate-glutamate transporter AGC1 n=1 Tax=Lachancea thermotolerans (strain ATCC 56472 / CBS 6340 / NRRL Y-8284) TaxID=559295 RepID=C5DHT6_LACTC|nr:KLTH0E06996p [Lachancea thermotolerans CBS 6340]CAR23347.1 KLTH0E06996p [Lachancea thermotolerans CBS 6340]